MNKITLYDNFVFLNYRFTKQHYRDSRKGSPMNYIAYMLKGQGKIVSDSDTIRIKEGDVFYIPKNLSYQSYWYGEDEISFISLGFSELNTNENTSFELQIVPCHEEVIKKIVTIPTKGSSIDCKTLSLFYDVMADIIPDLKYSCENNEELMVKKIKACLQRHPFCSLSEIADMCMISQPYLYLLFKKNTHITPNHYRQKVLCEMGVKLLITTDKKVEEISHMLNFSSSSYFRKILKKHTGSTPREIRKNGSF